MELKGCAAGQQSDHPAKKKDLSLLVRLKIFLRLRRITLNVLQKWRSLSDLLWMSGNSIISELMDWKKLRFIPERWGFLSLHLG